MEDYDMTDRLSSGSSKYRYKRNYTHLDNSESSNNKPIRRMKYDDVAGSDQRLTFQSHLNPINSFNDVEMTPISRPESIRRYNYINPYRSTLSDKVKNELSKYQTQVKQSDSNQLVNYYDCCEK
jgi:hypothetical protein